MKGKPLLVHESLYKQLTEYNIPPSLHILIAIGTLRHYVKAQILCWLARQTFDVGSLAGKKSHFFRGGGGGLTQSAGHVWGGGVFSGPKTQK